MSNNYLKNSNKNFYNLITLDQATPNAPYIIVKCNLPKPLQSRFAELGFVAGTKVTITKHAPLGDPMELRLLGYSLCVRANELKHVFVERVLDE